jgi:hypothetical protein
MLQYVCILSTLTSAVVAEMLYLMRVADVICYVSAVLIWCMDSLKMAQTCRNME